MQQRLEKDWELSIGPDTVRLFILKAKALSAAVNEDYDDGAEHEVELDGEAHASHHHDGLAEESSENLTEEELREVEGAIAAAHKPAIEEELGDLLFAVANLCRHLGVAPEAALRAANSKFTRRFAYVEARARADGIAIAEAGLDRLDGYWNEIRESDKHEAG